MSSPGRPKGAINSLPTRTETRDALMSLKQKARSGDTQAEGWLALLSMLSDIRNQKTMGHPA